MNLELYQELVRQINSVQGQVDGLVKPEISIDVVSPFLDLPGLVGFWPMSSVQRSTGNAYDLSGQGRTLTYNGNPTYNVYNNLVPYIDLDGTGDYLSRADETDLDILGTETIYAASVRGLTMGGWFWLDSLPGANFPMFIGKWSSTGNQRSYSIQGSLDIFRMAISVDGTAVTTIDSAAFVTGAWYFVVGRFTPSTEVAIFVNGVKVTNAVAIPASIFNGTSIFQIGGRPDIGHYIDGRASLPFLCANTLSDNVISALFSQTRAAFLI